MTENSLEQRLVDFFADDLDAHLPDHETFRYRRPPVILPENCPALVVWLSQERPTPKTTNAFDSEIMVGTSWHEEVVSQAQSLEPDEEKATALFDSLTIIKARIRAWAVDIPIHEAYQVLPGLVSYIEPRLGANLDTGLTEGYSANVLVSVTEG